MRIRKKVMASVLAAAIMAAQCTTAFAAPSSSSDGGSASSGSAAATQSTTAVTVTTTGVKTTGIVTSTTAGGSTIAVVVDTKTASGEEIRVNSNGEAVVGDKVVSFAKSEAATAGLPQNVVDTINNINGGKSLSTSVPVGYDLTERKPEDGKLNLDTRSAKGLNLDGYYALTGTHAIVTKNVNTGKVEDTATETVIYVPNLIEGLGNVAVLYYNNATNQWLLLPVIKIDPKSKLVYVTVTGSGTMTVVYKR